MKHWSTDQYNVRFVPCRSKLPYEMELDTWEHLQLHDAHHTYTFTHSNMQIPALHYQIFIRGIEKKNYRSTAEGGTVNEEGNVNCH